LHSIAYFSFFLCHHPSLERQFYIKIKGVDARSFFFVNGFTIKFVHTLPTQMNCRLVAGTENDLLVICSLADWASELRSKRGVGVFSGIVYELYLNP
jgi:hypothetical protein